MEITKAEFITSMDTYEQPEDALPQIAVAGRSNVGKSSLINNLCRRNGLARTSATPGKTRLINLFRVNDVFHLVDLPGYGFAKVGREEKARWGKMMDRYFAESEHLLLTAHLVDIRHEPTEDDRQMNAFLRAHNLPFIVVATKADKVSRGSRQKYLSPILRALQVQPWQVIAYSSETGEGREQLLGAFEAVLCPSPASD